MKTTCEVCGHELGFFERSLKIEQTRLGLSYKTLCSDCHRSILLAVDKIEAMVTQVEKDLKDLVRHYRYAATDINILIFLAVKAIFSNEPQFFQADNLLNTTFFPEEVKEVKTRFDYLVQITYKILREGFLPVLGRYGLESFDAFYGYMTRDSLYFNQIRSNCGVDGDIVYTDLYVCPAGLVFFDTRHGFGRTLFVSKDRTIRYELSHTGATYDLTILRQHFRGTGQHPTILFNRKDLRAELVKKLEKYNKEKTQRIEGELKNLIENLNVEIEKNLRNLHPDDDLEEIPLDSVLVSIIKTLFEQDIDQEFIKEAPEGLLEMIIERCYPVNFERSGLSEISEIKDYINDECRFVTDFNASFGASEPSQAFAFLTPRAYMIELIDSKHTYMQAGPNLPNDIYCDYQYMIYQGAQELFLSTASSEKGEDGYYFLTGVRIRSKDKRVLDEIESYFKKKALEYYEHELKKQESYRESIRDQELRDRTRRIFIGYGYLPFCIYDEWAAVERGLRQSDVLMETLIEPREKKTGNRDQKIFYAPKAINTFEQQSAQIAKELDIKKLPVARGLIFKKLLEEIREACSGEFIRLAGDIVGPGESLQEAVKKYSNITTVKPEKAYYLGLFIYYLMDKGVLEKGDFLDHYDDVVRIFNKLNPEKKAQIEFTPLKVPKKKSFDSKIEIKVPKKPTVDVDPFLLSIATDERDEDTNFNSALETAQSLRESEPGT